MSWEFLRTLLELEPSDFEELISRWLHTLGWETETTRQTADGGVDVVAENPDPLTGGLYLVQCKRYGPDQAVGVTPVRELYAIVVEQSAVKGLLVTTSRFTEAARAFARGKPLVLIAGQELCDRLGEAGIAPEEVRSEFGLAPAEAAEAAIGCALDALEAGQLGAELQEWATETTPPDETVGEPQKAASAAQPEPAKSRGADRACLGCLLVCLLALVAFVWWVTGLYWPRGVVAVRGDELANAVHANPVAAEQKYAGRWLRITGRCGSDPRYDSVGVGGVLCEFGRGELDTVPLREGDATEIVGRCAGGAGISRCRLVVPSRTKGEWAPVAEVDAAELGADALQPPEFQRYRRRWVDATAYVRTILDDSVQVHGGYRQAATGQYEELISCSFADREEVGDLAVGHATKLRGFCVYPDWLSKPAELHDCRVLGAPR